ncbi:MAG: hypothetical protein NTV87_11895, partial [Ignavibacteriae bacterium]|nr:hypothetical protein [Ignavibacteriota bacterium]
AINPSLPPGGKFSSLDFQHPVLEGIFRDKSLTATDFSPEIDAPDINSIFPALTGSGTSVLMSMKDNVPFLLETKTPGSPLLFCAVSADLQMSDFPKNPLFAPVITKSVAYLTSAFSGRAYSDNRTAIVNHDTLESNLSLAYSSEISEYFRQLGLKNVQIITNPGAELARVVAENRTGTSLWYWFIILAVLLTLLEMYYSKKLSN